MRSALVPPFTFFTVLGAAIGRGEDHRAVLETFGVNIADFLADTDARNDPEDGILPVDLYPDSRPTLQALRDRGNRVGIAANQPARAQAALEALNLPVDFVETSARWGVSKPSVEFFQRVVDVAQVPASDIVYVGDRIDNDVAPAKKFGMRTVFLRRGPWGYLHAQQLDVSIANHLIDSLTELL